MVKGRIPVAVRPERMGVLIGKGGRNKQRLEELFGVKLEVDEKKGIVYIIPLPETPAYKVLKAKNAVEAISLGFSIDDAARLAEDLVTLEIIDVSEAARNRSDLSRIMSRIIGSKGRFKKMLEEMTGASIVVTGKEVGVIGDYEQVRVVHEAVSRIVRGQSHGTVTTFLENENRLLKRRRMELWEKWEAYR